MNLLRWGWEQWCEWCDEDAPALPKRIGFATIVVTQILAVVLVAYRVISDGPLSPSWILALLFPFLITAGCAWQCGRRAWGFAYIGMAVIVAGLIAIVRA